MLVPHLRAERSADKILVGKPEGNRLLRRPVWRWEDSTTTDFKGIEWVGME